MAHSFFSEDYDLHQIAEADAEDRVTFSEVRPREESGFRYVWPKSQWVAFHNNASGPNEPVTFALRAIDGEELAHDDPRRVQITLPFGLLAEFVGMRVLRDKISRMEDLPYRHALGLSEQGDCETKD